MINCIAYDVEVLRNFFSITFVSINSYLKVFKDCVNADGKAIPLVQKLSVEEIKARLETVEKYKFYITDKDDSQLLSMIGYINKTRCYKDSNGNIIRTDLYGFNNFNYDNLMIAALLICVRIVRKNLLISYMKLVKLLFLVKMIKINLELIFILIVLENINYHLQVLM